ncbi:DUF2306 domain-containing protein [Aestuariivirga litoralis]|uniref:DUF2306 domain-containing protein n=1 Tax=Aestuariivirga litoralis TaxID=2650924 RepID=UPI0018C66A26|nr:DUF2306 domain-containing protein [Aestuariivirga litoralis]MBG1232565.1 DUF2306 domain-containing protein [Aestuariivirga litoralis]
MEYRSIVWRSSWSVFMLLATLVAIFSLRYGLPTVPFATLNNFVVHRTILIVHAISASIALLIGPWQFLPNMRQRRLWLHRINGRIYCTAVLVAWIVSIPMAMHAETGRLASAGFLLLGVSWITCTSAAVIFILCGKISSHRRWMIRSYALTAAAISLRIYMPLSGALGIGFEDAYPVVAWLCWVPNLLFAEIILIYSDRRPNMGSAITAP